MSHWRSSDTSPCLRLLSLILCVTVLVTQTWVPNAWAAPQPPEPHASALFPTEQFVLPDALGRVADRFTAPESSPQSPLIVHIQDLHTHEPAQAQIARILQ